MNYRYRVKGVAEKSFILQGIYFYAGKTVNNYIKEQELVFVQERCKLTEIVDLKSQNSNPTPMPNNSTETNRGVKDDTQSTIRTNKVKSATKV
jgi:hypothetical protein